MEGLGFQPFLSSTSQRIVVNHPVVSTPTNALLENHRWKTSETTVFAVSKTTFAGKVAARRAAIEQIALELANAPDPKVTDRSTLKPAVQALTALTAAMRTKR